jgi:lipopolysaccharide/colanic/teichoic acid biosynthesis glycosyltransferase
MNSFMDVCLAEPCNQGVDTVIPIWKRIFDITCITLAIPFWLPVMGVIAIAIKVLSPGPVFFKQERVGFMGRRFTCLKFRSMKHGADTGVHQQHLKQLIQSDQPMTKMDRAGDPRLIPGASLLRSSGLDELPQLLNVIAGDMSLVGPRPCTTNEFADYLEWHKERCRTLPGLTGLWQVSGKNKTTFSEMIHMDIHYARNCSLLMDLKIMFRTFSTLLEQVRESRAKADSKLEAATARSRALAGADSVINGPIAG